MRLRRSSVPSAGPQIAMTHKSPQHAHQRSLWGSPDLCDHVTLNPHMLTWMTTLDPNDVFTLQQDLYLRSTPDTIPLHLVKCQHFFHNHTIPCGATGCEEAISVTDHTCTYARMFIPFCRRRNLNDPVFRDVQH